MIGHEVRLSQTNSYGCVPLCQCGWIGNVVPAADWDHKKGARSIRRYELTENIARGAHDVHLQEVRADIAQRSDNELARIGKMIPLANATLQRRGRWGHS
jgi:hypothetical protein